MQQITAAQSSPEVPLNENAETLEHQAVYGKRHPSTSALTWGYYGGRWGGFTVADGTVTLTNNSANYLVVAVATGVLTSSTANTNWNNDTDYVRVYKVTTASGVVSAVEDHRAGPGGAHGGTGTGGGGGSGTVTSVAVSVPTFLSIAGSPITTLGTLAITLSGTAIPVANGGTGGTSASAARTALSAATYSQADEMISGFIGTVTDKTYKLVVKASHGGTITEATTVSESGTCTATWKINTTALGGTANSVSTSETSQAHASANAFSAGDDIQLTVSSNATCLGLSFTLKYTRVLA